MTGVDFLNNLIDELERVKDLIENGPDDIDLTELVGDIYSDLERYYDYAESLNSLLEDLIME